MCLELPLLQAMEGSQPRRAGGGPPQPLGQHQASQSARSRSAEHTRMEGARGSQFPLCPNTNRHSQLQNHPLPGVLQGPPQPSPSPACQGTAAFPPIVLHPSPSPGPRSLTRHHPRGRSPSASQPLALQSMAQGAAWAASALPSCSRAPPASVSQSAEPHAMLRRAHQPQKEEGMTL